MSRTDSRGTRWQRRLLLVAVLAGLMALPAGHDPAAGSCAAPYLTDPEASSGGTPPVVRIDQQLTVRGAAFVIGCDDTGGGDGIGCSKEPEETVTPMTDVRLLLRQDGREWELGTADAGSAEDDELGQVTWQVELPADVRPGRAALVAEPGEQSDPARQPIRIR